MESLLKSNDRIRFQDCDPFNHLNNGRYMDYFMHARELQIDEHYGLNFRRHLAQTGKTWFVVSNQIAYFKPAATGENVVIESKLAHYTDNELLVEFRMFDEAEQVLKSIAWSRFRYIDIQQQKSAKHPEELTALFSNVVLPIEQKLFEERVQAVMGEMMASAQR